MAKMIPFCFHVKAAEVAAEVTSRAAVSTKIVAGRSISAHHRVTALQFLFFMLLLTYYTILDLGYVNILEQLKFLKKRCQADDEMVPLDR
jgi:hypothetical protein